MPEGLDLPCPAPRLGGGAGALFRVGAGEVPGAIGRIHGGAAIRLADPLKKGFQRISRLTMG
jgi:hypothetical protein